jgi:hypothetical protein
LAKSQQGLFWFYPLQKLLKLNLIDPLVWFKS